MALLPQQVSRLLRKHRLAEIKQIGEGSFGKALLCQAEDGTKLVCKMVDVGQASQKEAQDAQKEGQLLASFRHPYIVQYRNMFVDGGCLCILMAFCEGGDLTSQIEKARNAKQRISEEQIMIWMCQAILALKYIHDRRVLHRDLKSSNFFLSKSGNLKMGDFGIAKVLSCTAAVAKTMIGTPYFLSPEVCQDKPYAWPSDIWAMGCVLYELCALKVPFNAPDMVRLVSKICKDPAPPIPEGYTEFVQQLFNDMLNRTPSQRPSAQAILQRPQMQTVVSQMLLQAQAAQAARGDRGAGPGTYFEGDMVEYYSNTHKDWLPASITNVDAVGRVMIDLKPNVWISLEQQKQQLRCVGAAAAVAPEQAPAGPEGPAAENAPEAPLASAAQGVANDRLGDDELSKLCEELGIADDDGAAPAGVPAPATAAEEADILVKVAPAIEPDDDLRITALLGQELRLLEENDAGHLPASPGAATCGSDIIAAELERLGTDPLCPSPR